MLGSNGEAASLDEDEKLALVRAARARAGGRAVLVGTGLDRTRATIALTEARGRPRGGRRPRAHPALLQAPDDGGGAAPALRGGGGRLARAGLPVLGAAVHGRALARPGSPPTLAAHPRIAGIKESSSDLGLLGRIITSVPARFEVACGSAPVLYPALCLGACAGVLAVANCAPELAVAHLSRVGRGRPRARAPSAGGADTAGGRGHGDLRNGGLKAAIDLAGLRGGHVRALRCCRWRRRPATRSRALARGRADEVLEVPSSVYLPFAVVTVPPGLSD